MTTIYRELTLEEAREIRKDASMEPGTVAILTSDNASGSWEVIVTTNEKGWAK